MCGFLYVLWSVLDKLIGFTLIHMEIIASVFHRFGISPIVFGQIIDQRKLRYHCIWKDCLLHCAQLHLHAHTRTCSLLTPWPRMHPDIPTKSCSHVDICTPTRKSFKFPFIFLATFMQLFVHYISCKIIFNGI